MSDQYTSSEMMTIVASRHLNNKAVCFVGIGLPSEAANLARNTHAPETVLIYESGTIGSKPTVLPLSIGDGELAETADFLVPVPEMFRYWLQGERIDVGFLGAAQIDKYANINTTVIGDYNNPKVRLPGAGGASEIASNCGEVLIMLKHSSRAFVEKLSFITSVGHLEGNDSRQKAGIRNAGPTAVITDLCVLTPDPKTKELTLTKIYPDVTVEQVQEATGWTLKVSDNVEIVERPSVDELTQLRDIKERSKLAHAG